MAGSREDPVGSCVERHGDKVMLGAWVDEKASAASDELLRGGL